MSSFDLSKITLCEYRFVDPKTWNGIGEEITDETLDADVRRTYADIALYIETSRAKPSLTPQQQQQHDRLSRDFEQYGPTDVRTLLVKVQLHGPLGKN